MEWVELVLSAGELADEVAALLFELAPSARKGVEVRDGDVILWAPAGEAEASRRELATAAARLGEAGWPVSPAGVRVRPAAPEDEWRDAWKRFFKVERLGRRLVIVPSWERYEPREGDAVLHLDPGRAFGTGAHASTRLCLLELEALCDEGLAPRRLLDLGTGSGILALAAARLWPEVTGVALDIDPTAVEVARENLDENGVLPRFETRSGSAGAVTEAFDVVVANIRESVLVELAPEIVARVARGGALVLSGLLAHELDDVRRRYEESGMTFLRSRVAEIDPDWASLVLRRSART